ncbi:MAG: bacillithiol system redox-active protein YtxJ [Flavobacteriales bacterium]
MNWNPLTDIEQLDNILTDSYHKPQLIFKHSTRCFISASVLRRLEADWGNSPLLVAPHFLDLLKYRSISDVIAKRFGVVHESPQIILFINGVVSFHTSHDDISVDVISDSLAH